jgi:hypothetical protein
MWPEHDQINPAAVLLTQSRTFRRLARATARMIYDCFPFFNEVELLELRLHELAGMVDKFMRVSDLDEIPLPRPLKK